MVLCPSIKPWLARFTVTSWVAEFIVMALPETMGWLTAAPAAAVMVVPVAGVAGVSAMVKVKWVASTLLTVHSVL